MTEFVLDITKYRHQRMLRGNFHAGEAGSVLKKLDAREQACFVQLMSDTLRSCVPEYRGNVDKNGELFIQLQDLLCTFDHPCVMDVKMGVRTYLEEELQKARKSPSLRKDMYQKMIEIDCTAPTNEENEHKAVTKPRYMQWRDEMSSSVELGFRVEGIKKSDGNSSKDFKKTKTRDNVVDILKSFVGDNESIVEKYMNRLKEIMHTQEASEFFHPMSKQKRNRLMKIGKKVQLILKEIKAKIKSANKEEDDKIQMILLAVDSMCKCKGIVDEILRERPGVAQANLRNFKYALFEKALGFVEEFNTIVRVLVIKQLNVDIATTFSDNGIRYSNLFHSILGKL
ncbi:hypothetical protein Btru_077887 [Bulinus truncatus]|nr:hypothetical protein Btru_077887 [Bulinus truncatus]